MKKAVKERAEKLIDDYRDAAYEKAQEAMRAARRHRNSRLERYWAKVARQIARCMTSLEGGAKAKRPEPEPNLGA
jgi:F0F1-type ATP synthase membrane subunit b/b'